MSLSLLMPGFRTCPPKLNSILIKNRDYSIKNLYQKPTVITMKREDVFIFIGSSLGIWVMLEFLTFVSYGGLFLLTGVTLSISLGAAAQITMLWMAQHMSSKDENLKLRRDLRMVKLNIMNAKYSKLNPYPHFFS